MRVSPPIWPLGSLASLHGHSFPLILILPLKQPWGKTLTPIWRERWLLTSSQSNLGRARSYIQTVPESLFRELVENEVKSGLGVYSSDLQLAISNRISNNSSVFTAELLAIKIALESIYLANHNKNNYLIVSDSLSSIVAIESPSSRRDVPLLFEVRDAITHLINA